MNTIPKKFYKVIVNMFVICLISLLMDIADYTYQEISIRLISAILTTAIFAFLLIALTAVTDVQIFFEKALGAFKQLLRIK